MHRTTTNPFGKWWKSLSSMGVTCKCVLQELDMFRKRGNAGGLGELRVAENGTALPMGPHGRDPTMKHLICHSKMFRSYPM